ASGALLLLAMTMLLITLLRLMEWAHHAIGKHYWLNGQRAAPHPLARGLVNSSVMILIVVNLMVLAALLLWSLTRRWPFPALWPSQWSTHYWQDLLPTLLPLLATSLGLALASAGLALIMAIISLEGQTARRPWPLWLICLPLLLPQASLLFGIRFGLDWLLSCAGIGIGIAGPVGGGIGWSWVLWSQLLFVFPYVYLCLHGPYRQFDPRITHCALLLGASQWRIWWNIKAPLLAKPLLFALAVGAAVSLAQYVPTLLFGAGRVVTITTEAVAIGSGLNRRLAGLYGLLQLLLPQVIYLLALTLPARVNPALKDAH
ncbi:MAG: ABC transporter permease, partial [Aeromonas sp.]